MGRIADRRLRFRAFSNLSATMRRAVALLLVLLGGLLLLWRSSESPPAPPAASGPVPAPAGPIAAARPERPTAETATPVAPSPPGLPPALPEPVAPPATLPGSNPVLAPPAIREIVAANSTPGRMLFLDFALDRAGLRLVSASGAAGRAKPAGSRPGFGFIHFEAYGADGSLRLTGSVEDPTRRRLEHPAATGDGRIANTVQFADEGTLALRLPGEIAPTRLVLFRDRNPGAPTPAGREILGDFRLLSSP